MSDSDKRTHLRLILKEFVMCYKHRARISYETLVLRSRSDNIFANYRKESAKGKEGIEADAGAAAALG